MAMAPRGWGYSTASPRCSCHGHPTPAFPFPCTVWNGLLTIKELGLALAQPQSLFVWGGGCWPLGPRVLARHPQAGLLPALLLKVPKWCRSHRVTGSCGSPLPHSSLMGPLPASGGCRAQPPGSSHAAENTRVTHTHTRPSLGGYPMALPSCPPWYTGTLDPLFLITPQLCLLQCGCSGASSPVPTKRTCPGGPRPLPTSQGARSLPDPRNICPRTGHRHGGGDQGPPTSTGGAQSPTPHAHGWASMMCPTRHPHGVPSTGARGCSQWEGAQAPQPSSPPTTDGPALGNAMGLY